MALAKSRFSDESGFSLAEVLVATIILAVGLMAVAQMFGASTMANASARANTFTVLLAEQKMEQLRALSWGFDTVNLPVSDETTDTTNIGALAGCSTSGTGRGTGLSPSPSGTLAANTDGWVDYLDQNGCALGGGGSAPDGTIYTRRWSVEPLPTNPNNTLIFQVLVTRRSNRGDGNDASVARRPDEARLMSVKTRKTR
jgi:prepilin-type N-terminal cleavage/methylation domain-containing protein